MILIGVLMLGMAMAIPASQTIQEANMRERLASFGSDSPASSNPEPTASRPALLEASDVNDDDDDDPDKTNHKLAAGDERVSVVSTEEADTPEADPQRMPEPTHLRIPSVEIDTEIVPVSSHVVEVNGQRLREWDVASYAAGFHDTSARPGEVGNTVITGHNDWEGEVFRTLEYAEIGDAIFVETDAGEFQYVIEEIHLRREVGVSMEERLATGQFMASMPDERVTLITCWPYGINDHRIIVVAKPVS
jgi:sortase A